MTETLVVLSTAFAGFLFADPFFGGALTKASVAKWPLLVLSFGTLAFHLFGRAVTDPRRLKRAMTEVLSDWWPLVSLALLISVGSLVARYGYDVKENFLGMGLGMLFLPLMAVAVRASKSPMLFMKLLLATYVLTTLGMLVVLCAQLHVFHEEIFLAVPLGAYFLTARPLRIWQALIGLILIGGCLLSVKNTTFLLVLATLAGCVAVSLMRMSVNRRSQKPILSLGKLLILLWSVPIALGGFGALAWVWWSNRPLLPSGNVEYRTEMYRLAWERFLNSPIWGSGFTDSSVTYFTLYRVGTATQNLPTHSDILDLLGHGGLIAIALWAMAVWRLGRISFAALPHVAYGQGAQAQSWRWLYVLALVQLGALITYAVNPPLINPVHGFWMWGSAGVLWALHRTLIEPIPAPALVRHVIRKKAAWI